MQFSLNTLALLLTLSTSALSAPTSCKAVTAAAAAVPAASATPAAGGAVLSVQTYNDFSVSAGVSGDALAEVNAKFPVSGLV